MVWFDPTDSFDSHTPIYKQTQKTVGLINSNIKISTVMLNNNNNNNNNIIN